MTSAIELSELGMINDMRLLDLISNNLANANTPGFKRDIGVTHGFQDLLATHLAAQPDGSAAQQGQLVPSLRLLSDQAAGTLSHTGNPLDVAIEGDGFFEFQSDAGVRYSRNGAFTVDATGRLVSNHGFVVTGVDGDILLGGGDVTIDRDGSVFENAEYAGKFQLISFDDMAMLEKEGRGLMRAMDGAVARDAESSSVRQGYQEASNVQVMDEMVLLMTTMRHFEMTSRVLKGYDEMIDTAIATIAEF